MEAVFLHYRERSPELIQVWRSEASNLWKRGGSKNEKLPDEILDQPGAPKIIEFGGAYSKAKLEKFHDYCESTDTPYEVW